MKHPDPFLIILFLAVTMVLSGCSSEQITEQPFVTSGYTGSVQVAQSNSRELSPITHSTVQSLSRSSTALSETNAETGIAKLNGIGSSVRIPLSQFTYRMIDMGRYYHKLTDGAYDFTTAGISELWRTGRPDEATLEAALSHSGMRFVETSDNGTAALTAPGVKITPGLLIPAYALDTCLVDSRRKYKGPMMIRYGPFARRDGKFPGDAPPLLPVYAPSELNNILLGQLDLSETTAAAQLTLPHRILTKGGRPDQVLVDPRSGQPASGATLAVVTGPIATKAYALAEALLVLGLEDGTKILPNFPGYEAMIIPDREPVECWMTPGFKYYFQPVNPLALPIQDWTVESRVN